MWVDGFRSADDYRLNSDEGERSIDEGRHESQESSSGTSDAIVIDPRTWVVPVAEADGLAVGPTASGDDNRNEDQSNEAENLDRASNYFSVTIEANAHEVDG